MPDEISFPAQFTNSIGSGGAGGINTFPAARHEKVDEEAMVASEQFLRACGLEPTQDSIDQLAQAFLPALKIMCERGYHTGGETWRQKGWRGQVQDILNKAGRMRYHSWLNNKFDRDSALDIINFAGFYIRLENKGEPWGTWGEPGSEEI